MNQPNKITDADIRRHVQSSGALAYWAPYRRGERPMPRAFRYKVRGMKPSDHMGWARAR